VNNLTIQQDKRIRFTVPKQMYEIPLSAEPDLVQAGAVYVATFVGRSEADPARLTTARFGILVQTAQLPDDQPFRAIADDLVARDEPREITFDEFPAGPALLVEESLRDARFAQLILAFPGRRRIVTLGLSTTDTGDWPHYLRLLRTVASTVSMDCS